MAEVRVRYRWPDGAEGSAYCPSNLVRKVLREGDRLPVAEFGRRLSEALETASLRVRDHAGHRCSIADGDAAVLQREVAERADSSGEVEVIELETL